MFCFYCFLTVDLNKEMGFWKPFQMTCDMLMPNLCIHNPSENTTDGAVLDLLGS